MKRRIFVDTEWTAPPWSAQSDLLWIGLADEDGRSWYGISSEVEIDPSNDFIAGLLPLITPNEPRMSRQQLAAAVVDFCGPVDEFWAWIPTVERFAEWSGLGEEAAEVFDRYWNVDLQMLRALVKPWPLGWPNQLHNSTRLQSPPVSRFHLRLQTTSIHVSTPNGIGTCSSSFARQAAFGGSHTCAGTDGGLAE